MKTNFLLRVLYLCISAFFIFLKAEAQDKISTQSLEIIKSDFLQERYDSELTTPWAQGNQIKWVPQWDSVFYTHVEDKKELLVPLTPKLQSQLGGEYLPFKMIGARRYIVITGNDNATKYQVMTLSYDAKKQHVQGFAPILLKDFNGTVARQAIGNSSGTIGKYKNGKREVGKSTSPTLDASRPTGSGELVCNSMYTCYWSGSCQVDGVAYGTITNDQVGCMTPFTYAGPCMTATWILVDSRVTKSCYYIGPDFDSDWGGGGAGTGGTVPTDRPCPGDPLLKMNIAASNAGNPGNIRGGTFGPDVRTNEDGTKKKHEGIDLVAIPGTPIFAAAAGEVIGVQSSFAPGQYAEGSYGNYVYIKNVDGTFYKYNHLDGIRQGLSVGDKINAGAQIGTAGTTGNAASKKVVNKHLHLQMFNAAGKPINPQPYLRTTMDMKTGKGRRPC